MAEYKKVSEGSLYSGLPASIQYNLSQHELKRLQGSAKDYVRTFLTSVVKQNAKDWETRIRYKPLMLDNIKQSNPKRRQRKKEMSTREKKAMGVYRISPQNQKYSMYLPLHKLWTDYMCQMLNLEANSNLSAMYPKLLRADYHGCSITVTRSKCPSYVGTSGIILQETKNIFRVITKDDKLKMIPKANSLFVFELGEFVFTIHGNHFRYRSSERSARKFKCKPTVDL